MSEGQRNLPNLLLGRPRSDKTRAEYVRESQAARRKKLGIKTITVEVQPDVHTKIKAAAGQKHMTMQELIVETLDQALSLSGSRPWDVFGDDLIDDSESKYTHVSLFSGCGGVDLGFRQAGFKTVLANDIDPDACRTYRANLGEIIEDDLRKISFPPQAMRPDVLTAGFPCQPFSNAGARKGVGDDRGQLFMTAINVVKELRPRVVVFENVRGLLSFKNGEKLLITEICEELDAAGYDVVFSLIDASRHHVPQKRQRLFIVGTERSSETGTFSFPTPIDRSDLTLGHTVMDVPDAARNQNEFFQLNPQALYLGDLVPEGGSWKDIPYDKLPDRLKKISDNIVRYRWPNFYRKFHRTEIAGTITASFKPENAGVWHPRDNRVLSVREIARIQSFPDWYEFDGRSVKSKYKQIGNAVPPRLAYEIALQVVRCLSGESLRTPSSMYSFQKFIAGGKPLRARDRDIVFIRQPEIGDAHLSPYGQTDVLS